MSQTFHGGRVCFGDRLSETHYLPLGGAFVSLSGGPG